MAPLIRAHIALFLVALIYGGNYSVAKIVLDDEYIQPLGFIVLRLLAGCAFFSLLHFLVIREKIERSDWPRLALCALFGVAINQMCFFLGLKLTKPINASLILTTTPILVLIISSILIRERITTWKILGILLGATGAILLLAVGRTISFQQSGFLGDLLVFVNATSYGIYLVIVKRLMQKYHPFTVLRWVFTFGMVIVLPLGWNDVTLVEWNTFSPLIWWSVAYVLIGTTILAYLFNGYALKIVNPSIVSIYIYLQPVVAAIISILIGQDSLNFQKILAAALIFAGVFLVSKRAKPHIKTL